MQQRNIKIIIIFLVLSMVVCLWLWQASIKPLTPEQQISRLLIDAQNAFNKGDSTKFLGYISQDYDDGSYTRRELVPLVFKAVKVENNLRVTIMQPVIIVDNEVADVMAPVHVQRQATRSMDTSDNTGYDLQVQLRLHFNEQHWEVTRATGWEYQTDDRNR